MNFLQRKYWQTSYLSHRIIDSFPWILKMKTGVDFMILFHYPRKIDTVKNCRYFFLKRADTITFSEALGPKKYELGKQKESMSFFSKVYIYLTKRQELPRTILYLSWWRWNNSICWSGWSRDSYCSHSSSIILTYSIRIQWHW